MVRQIVVSDPLGFACFIEAKVDDGTTDPGDETRSVRKIDEPVEDDRAAGGYVQIGETDIQRAEGDGSIRDARLGTSYTSVVSEDRSFESRYFMYL